MARTVISTGVDEEDLVALSMYSGRWARDDPGGGVAVAARLSSAFFRDV